MSMIYRPEDFADQFRSIAGGVSSLLNARTANQELQRKVYETNTLQSLGEQAMRGDSNAFGGLAGLSPASANALTNRFMAPYEQQLLNSRSMAAEAESLQRANEAKKNDDIENLRRITAYGSLAVKSQSPEQKRMAWNALRGNLISEDGTPNEMGSRLMQSIGVKSLPVEYPGDEFVYRGVDMMQGLLHSLGAGPKSESKYGSEASALGYLPGTKPYFDAVDRLRTEDNAQSLRRAKASSTNIITNNGGEKNAPLDSVGRRAVVTNLMEDQQALAQVQAVQDNWKKEYNKTLSQFKLKALEIADKNLPESTLSASQRSALRSYQGYVSELRNAVLDSLLKYAATTFTDSTRGYIEKLLPTDKDGPTAAEAKLIKIKETLQRSIAIKTHALSQGVAVDSPEGLDYINKRIMGGFDPRRSKEAATLVRAHSVDEFRRILDENPKTRDLDPARKDAMAKSMAEDSMRQMGFNK